MGNIENYALFVEKYRTFAYLGSINEILGWDQQVLMPKKAAGLRQKQSEALAKQIYTLQTAADYGDLLQRLYDSGSDSFTAVQWHNISEAWRAYQESVRLPERLVISLARLAMEGYAVWEQAKAENRFQDFAPIISRFIELKKESAGILYPDKNCYDVCLDHFERGLCQKRIDPIFAILKDGVLNLLKKIQNGQTPPTLPLGDYPFDLQIKLARDVVGKLGFSFAHGRIDESVHPFTGGYRRCDVRMTSKYQQNFFYTGLSSLMHESGHAIYEQGLPDGDSEFMPSGAPLGMMVHESQSILYERQIGQTLEFFRWLLPKAQEVFGSSLAGVSAETLYKAVNVVSPGLIRIEADEVTYPLHIILRYELEKQLFSGDLSVADLPSAWHEMSQELLGVRANNDTDGVLQDVHWSDGSYGYFPCYALGAVYAAQIFATICQDLPDTLTCIANGDFSGIKTWLNKNIHCYGSLYEADTLVKNATGQEPTANFFLSYLEKKYATIYDV